MSWPPNPDKDTQSNQPNNPNDFDNVNNQSANYGNTQPTGREWQLIEKTMLANVEEQRKSRRWNIISKLLSLGMVLLMFMLMRGCSTMSAEQSANGFNQLNYNAPHLAVVNVSGAISTDTEANAQDIVAAMTEAYENDNAKAVALNINSPGGSPVQSDEVWLAAKDLQQQYPDKKLYAVIGDIGASGAYYIASAADEIYVNPSSLVGSIGVIMSSYDAQELMKKVGLKDRTMHAGEYKDILSMGRPMTEFEKQHVDSVLANTHQHFIDAVKQGRGNKLKNPEENKLFTGLFWTGEQAIELGLADKTGGISQLERDLELTQSYDYTVVDPMQSLLDRFAIKMGAGFASVLSAELGQQILGEQQGAELR